MAKSLLIELGPQYPKFGYCKGPMPDGAGAVRQLNLWLVGLVLFPDSLPGLIDKWAQLNRREAWEAVTGGASTEPDAEAGRA